MVSVVVPIYNVEKILDKCIESIVNQTYKNLEIILVDDSSPDNCPQMCDIWAEKDSRIKVIHKNNQGLGLARNTGIENATGDYICFFDSDDYVSLDIIEKCVNVVNETSADAVLFGLVDVNENGEVLNSTNLNISGIYKDNKVKDELLPELILHDYRKGTAHNFAFSSCTGIFSLSLIKENNLKFLSEREIISEDSYFLLQLYSFCRKVVLLPEAAYFHYVNVNSLTCSFRKDRQEKNNLFLKEALELTEKLNYSDLIKNRVTALYHQFTIAALKQIVFSEDTGRYNTVREILKMPELNDTFKIDVIKTEKRLVQLFFICAKFRMYFLCYFMLKIKKG